jgi:hypothetical protein
MLQHFGWYQRRWLADGVLKTCNLSISEFLLATDEQLLKARAY